MFILIMLMLGLAFLLLLISAFGGGVAAGESGVVRPGGLGSGGTDLVRFRDAGGGWPRVKERLNRGPTTGGRVGRIW